MSFKGEQKSWLAYSIITSGLEETPYCFDNKDDKTRSDLRLREKVVDPASITKDGQISTRYSEPLRTSVNLNLKISSSKYYIFCLNYSMRSQINVMVTNKYRVINIELNTSI